jgi:uncharacterized DUF497 family protein
VKVEWDAAKDRENRRKHGLSFSEAVAVLDASDTLEIFDVDHSRHEERFISIGPIRVGWS